LRTKGDAHLDYQEITSKKYGKFFNDKFFPYHFAVIDLTLTNE
jgi:hypothetical protein